MASPPRKCVTLDELTEFFHELPLHEPCVFQNVLFIVFHRGPVGFSSFGAVLGLLGASPFAAFKIRDVLDIGDYVMVRLPVSLGAELSMCSRDKPMAEEDSLAARFQIEATHSGLARQRLAGSFTAELLRLYDEYHLIEMRDEYISFGPLVRTAAENAASLATLINAVAALCSSFWDDTVVEPDVGEDASFCFHCGFTVREGTPVCPRCGGRLDEDTDEDGDG